ncbi:MAG: Phosphoglucomutase [Candidatus Anoxychlamydiales bacterium]|nr:Phosphoglucomutase [Candidatus Anoxychlamydiales bacterium]NGX41043.1 Phosphoglucomutase [Candidatus Anoxychlamydiales bacterium]HEU64296.1 phospho-sugar mutase [Chlamydiota bacterium]
MALKMDQDFSAKKRIQTWLEGPFDDETKNEIKKLLKENSKELVNAFSDTLTFGTGGIRAKMGIGTNRLNKYTIAIATQALSNYILSQKSKDPSVLIGFDNRQNSKLFAFEASKVLAANKIKVYLLKELRPTPIVSFGCRFKNCISAIMITASHNPKEYNGYKVYWKDGGQVLPPHDTGIIAEYNKIDSIEKVKLLDTIEHPLIEFILEEIDKAYTKNLFSLELFKNKIENPNLKIVYSNFHGTGITLTPKCLNELGFKDIFIVKEQEAIDPNFTNAPKPNPEEKESLELGIRYLKEKNADIFIATDPDADRVGAVINHENTPYILTGNELSCIMLNYLCKKKSLYSKTAAIKTIVTTELFTRISEHYDIHSIDVLTGFKYIAEKIHEFEVDNSFEFIFGAEESLGYLIHTFARDKDAISASLLIAKIALDAKKENKTLIDLLYDLYQTHGIYREKQASIAFEPTLENFEKMKKLMQRLRENPPKTIANETVAFIDDYKTSETLDLQTQTKTILELPSSDVLRFWLADNSKIVIRPSGTEPKVKIYVGVQELNITDLKNDIKKCDMHLDVLIDAIELEMKS